MLAYDKFTKWFLEKALKKEKKKKESASQPEDIHSRMEKQTRRGLAPTNCSGEHIL